MSLSLLFLILRFLFVLPRVSVPRSNCPRPLRISVHSSTFHQLDRDRESMLSTKRTRSNRPTRAGSEKAAPLSQDDLVSTRLVPPNRNSLPPGLTNRQIQP